MLDQVIANFNEHPNGNGQTYVAHMYQALVLSAMSLIASLALLLHAFFPFVLQTQGGDIAQNVATRITAIRASNAGGRTSGNDASEDDDEGDDEKKPKQE